MCINGIAIEEERRMQYHYFIYILLLLYHLLFYISAETINAAEKKTSLQSNEQNLINNENVAPSDIPLSAIFIKADKHDCAEIIVVRIKCMKLNL